MSNIIQFPTPKREHPQIKARRVTLRASYDLKSGTISVPEFVKVRGEDAWIDNPLALICRAYHQMREDAQNED